MWTTEQLDAVNKDSIERIADSRFGVAPWGPGYKVVEIVTPQGLWIHHPEFYTKRDDAIRKATEWVAKEYYGGAI